MAKVYNVWLCVEEFDEDEETWEDRDEGKLLDGVDLETAIDTCNSLLRSFESSYEVK